MITKNILKAAVVALSACAAFNAVAEPRTLSGPIANLRAYTSGVYFVTLPSADMADGTTCNKTYKVKADGLGAKAVIASLLTAFALGSDVQLEIPTTTGCEGFGTPIQSAILNQAIDFIIDSVVQSYLSSLRQAYKGRQTY